MSKYSNEPDIATQTTEGFACGFDINDTLHELSPNDRALYEDSKPSARASRPVADDTMELDDDVYNEPSSNRVTFMDEQQENFNVCDATDNVKSYVMRAVELVRKHWFLLTVFLVAFVVGYMMKCGSLPLNLSMLKSFRAPDLSSSFRDSSSLGSVVRQMGGM